MLHLCLSCPCCCYPPLLVCFSSLLGVSPRLWQLLQGTPETHPFITSCSNTPALHSPIARSLQFTRRPPALRCPALPCHSGPAPLPDPLLIVFCPLKFPPPTFWSPVLLLHLPLFIKIPFAFSPPRLSIGPLSTCHHSGTVLSKHTRQCLRNTRHLQFC